MEGRVERIARENGTAADDFSGEGGFVEGGEEFERAAGVVAEVSGRRLASMSATKAASCAACVEPTSGGKLCQAWERELPSSCAVGESVKRQLSRV